MAAPETSPQPTQPLFYRSLRPLDVTLHSGLRLKEGDYSFTAETPSIPIVVSEFGRAALAEMLRRGIVIDVAHSSPAVVEDVLAATDAPLLVSHTGTYGHCPGPRNIPDALMQRIAARGGLIGIGFWAEAICDASPAGIAAALDAAVALLGEDAVALGSDFDGAVTTTIDAAGMSAITAALLARGVDERRIVKLMGGNVRDFLLRSLPPAP